MRHDFRNVIGALIYVWIGNHQEHSFRRAFDQAARGFERGDASALRADQGSRHVKAVFRQQLIQVVAGDAARNVGIFFADGIAILFGEAWSPA